MAILPYSYSSISILLLIIYNLPAIESEPTVATQKLVDPFSVELYHKFGDQQSDFKHRGTIKIRPPTDYKPPIINLKQQDLVDADFKAFEKAIKEDDLYYLRAEIKKKGENNSIPLDKESILISQTIAKSCLLANSNLRDYITVNLNQKNEFISINLHLDSTHCDLNLDTSLLESLPKKLTTTVKVKNIEEGPTPETATYIKRLEEERLSKLKEGKVDNRSFFAKYWMYIVPAILGLMIMGGPGPEGEGR